MSLKLDEIVEYIKTCSYEDLYRIRRDAQNRINYLNWSTKHVQIVIKPTEFGLRMAKLLWNTVRVNFPIMKEPNLDSWAFDIDKIHRVDNISEELIEAILVWSQNDNFWKNNVRSGSALRRHFESIYAQAKTKHDLKVGEKRKVYKV